jgi:hypothetical protein
VKWDTGDSNNYRFGNGYLDVVAVRKVYHGITGEQVPKVRWEDSGRPLPEHVCSSISFWFGIFISAADCFSRPSHSFPRLRPDRLGRAVVVL